MKFLGYLVIGIAINTVMRSEPAHQFYNYLGEGLAQEAATKVQPCRYEIQLNRLVCN